MRVAVVSGSLHPRSRSRVMARETLAAFERQGAQAEWIDLRRTELPLCDGTANSRGGDVARLAEVLGAAAAIVVASPIYNYDVNAAVKNLVEQTGRAWTDKVVGFLCAAGGRSSYMSVMGLANSLMLDFRCVVVPRFVYATTADFGPERTEAMQLTSDEVRARIDELAREVLRLARG